MGEPKGNHRTFRANPTAGPRAFVALLIDETGNAEPTRLFHDGQDFSQTAVLWELANVHPLLEKNGKPFIPLVTRVGATSAPSPATPDIRQGATPAPPVWVEIVGYSGWVKGMEMWTEDAAEHQARYRLPEGWTVGDDLPVRAIHVALPRELVRQREDEMKRAGRGWAHFSEHHNYHIICSSDGEVLAIVGTEWAERGVESEGIGPIGDLIDLLTGAKAVKSIGGALRRGILTLSVSAGKKALARGMRAIGRVFRRKPAWYARLPVKGRGGRRVLAIDNNVISDYFLRRNPNADVKFAFEESTIQLQIARPAIHEALNADHLGGLARERVHVELARLQHEGRFFLSGTTQMTPKMSADYKELASLLSVNLGKNDAHIVADAVVKRLLLLTMERRIPDGLAKALQNQAVRQFLSSRGFPTRTQDILAR